MGLACSYVGSKFKLGGRGEGHELSGALLDTEGALSNIIWILFDYIFFRLNIHKKGTFHPVQNVVEHMPPRLAHAPRFLRPPVPTPC